MKKYTLILCSILLALSRQNLEGIAPQNTLSSQNGFLNEFGLSTITPSNNLSSDQESDIIHQRITHELGENFTLQDIFTFLEKIQVYYDHLLNTQTLNPETLLLAKLALQDMKKAKMAPYIKANTVTPEDEHNLRIAIGKLNRQISPHN